MEYIKKDGMIEVTEKRTMTEEEVLTEIKVCEDYIVNYQAQIVLLQGKIAKLKALGIIAKEV